MNATWPIVCFSSAYWDEPLWTNKQHVMSRLAGRGHRVLYVDPGARLRGLRGSQIVRWISHPQPNLWRLHPTLLPLRHFHRLKPLSWQVTVALIRAFLRYQGWANPLVWIYHPEAVRALPHLPSSLICYDCVDDWASFPQYAARRQEIIGLEERLVRRADLVFVTAPKLLAAKRALNPHTHLVPNVGDYDHFSRAMDPATATPPGIARLAHPVIGFVGALDDYKVNVGWVARLARTHPHWSLLLIGPGGVAADLARVDLSALPNVHALGFRPYADLPGYLKACDVCIIPYRLSEHTASVFPIKFFEMLATGRPVVATALPALQPYAGVARLAHTAEEFVRHVEEAVAAGPAAGRTQRLALARRHTWEDRVDRLETLVRQRLAERTR